MKHLITLLYFVLALALGAFFGFEIAPQMIQKKLKFVDTKTQLAPIEEIALDIVYTTEISGQSYTSIMLSEAKKEVALYNSGYESQLESEQFWANFKKDNQAEISSLDKNFYQLVANSLIQFNKNELLEYLNLKRSDDVKGIQLKITEYMKDQYPLDQKKYSERLKALVYEYYEKVKDEERFTPPPTPELTDETPQPKEI